MGYRRKQRLHPAAPEELLSFDVERWAPRGSHCDPWRATAAHNAWCAARAAWASTSRWPTGDDQRGIEEAITMPDEPFDVKEALSPPKSRG